MSPVSLMKTMELVAYELACAETHERKAASHRREAISLQAAVHAEFKAALTEVQDRPKRNLEKTDKSWNNQTTV
jgi:hypothetical protein